MTRLRHCDNDASDDPAFQQVRPRKVSLDFVEGLHSMIRVIPRLAYGLRDEESLQLKILACMLPVM